MADDESSSQGFEDPPPATLPPEWAADVYDFCRGKSMENGEVYPPSDDSFFLLETVVSDYLERPDRDAAERLTVLELGSGSAFVLSGVLRHLAQRRKASTGLSVSAYATDKNPEAVLVSGMALERPVWDAPSKPSEIEVSASALECSFADALDDGVGPDLIFFNPPYVPTPADEMEGNGVSISWAGGADGREVIDDFFASGRALGLLRRAGGTLYMCGMAENRPTGSRGLVELAGCHGVLGELIAERTAGIEDLWVLRFHAAPRGEQ